MEELKTALLLSNFADESSRYILDMKNLPISGKIYCNEYVVDDQRSLEWDREQVLISNDTQMLIELPKASVRLLIFTPESPKKE